MHILQGIDAECAAPKAREDVKHCTANDAGGPHCSSINSLDIGHAVFLTVVTLHEHWIVRLGVYDP